MSFRDFMNPKPDALSVCRHCQKPIGRRVSIWYATGEGVGSDLCRKHLSGAHAPLLRVKNVGGSGNKGQFVGTKMDRPCVCGHTFGDHTAGKPHECLGANFAGCDAGCVKFRAKRSR